MTGYKNAAHKHQGERYVNIGWQPGNGCDMRARGNSNSGEVMLLILGLDTKFI